VAVFGDFVQPPLKGRFYGSAIVLVSFRESGRELLSRCTMHRWAVAVLVETVASTSGHIRAERVAYSRRPVRPVKQLTHVIPLPM